MQTTQRTTCQVYVHPAASPERIFEVRRAARDEGCRFVGLRSARPFGAAYTRTITGGRQHEAYLRRTDPADPVHLPADQ